MKKQNICLILVIFLVASLIAGCRHPAEDPAVSETADSSSSSVSQVGDGTDEAGGAESVVLRVSWWGSDARHEAALKNMQAYTAKNPHVTFEPEYGAYGGYLDKLYVQLASKTVPDVPAIDGKWVPDMMRNYKDSFLNLKELDIDLSGFDPEFLTIICGDADFTLGASMGTNTFGVVYSPAFMEKFGLGDPSNWSWNDYLEAGKKVREHDPQSNLMYNMINNYGYTVKWYIKQKTGKPLLTK